MTTRKTEKAASPFDWKASGSSSDSQWSLNGRIQSRLDLKSAKRVAETKGDLLKGGAPSRLVVKRKP